MSSSISAACRGSSPSRVTFITGLIVAVAVISASCAASENDRQRPAYSTHSHSSRQSRTTIDNQKSIDQLSQLQSENQQLLQALERRLEGIEQHNNDRTDKLEVQIRQILHQQMRLDRSAEDNTKLLQTVRSEVESHHPQGQPPAATPSVTDKLEALAVLLQSTRRSIYALNITLAESLHGLTNSVNALDVSPSNPSLRSDVQAVSLSAPIGCDRTNHRNRSGVHLVLASASIASEAFYAFCVIANERDRRPWTVILSRSDAEISFQRSWAEYRNGFGNVAADHWIGLDRLSEITNARMHELLVELEDFAGEQTFASYGAFAIGHERQQFALTVLGTYIGSAGDSLSYHAGQKFSTFDVDNDEWSHGNCAVAHTGAWWYRACEKSNLAGQYLSANVSETQHNQGIYWDTFNGPNHSLRRVRMMIRPLN